MEIKIKIFIEVNCATVYLGYNWMISRMSFNFARSCSLQQSICRHKYLDKKIFGQNYNNDSLLIFQNRPTYIRTYNWRKVQTRIIRYVSPLCRLQRLDSGAGVMIGHRQGATACGILLGRSGSYHKQWRSRGYANVWVIDRVGPISPNCDWHSLGSLLLSPSL